MSTIRAKQQICLNISTIRCLSSYTSGRYCLRFSIYQTSNIVNNETYESQIVGTTHHHISKHATPVSIIEYKNNINKNINHLHNYNVSDRSSALYDINQHIYTTKPFLLKPNLEVSIYQVAIFKHDINIFSARYQNDFHDVVLRVVCELVQLDYSSGQKGKIVSVFDGRIRGAGINDAILIDFLEGVTGCQVIGSVHTCVYQFEYVYTGGPIYYPLNTINSNKNFSNNKKVEILVKNEGKYDERGGKQRRENKQIGQRTGKIDKNSVLINNMTFQMYCNIQSKQYVESLLQYLLKQIKKSEQKVDINLQVFQQENYNTNIVWDKDKDKDMKKDNIEQIEMEKLQLLKSLTKSLFNQKQIDKQQGNDKERLSLIKSQLIKDVIQQEEIIMLDGEQQQYQDERHKKKEKEIQNYRFKSTNNEQIQYFGDSDEQQREKWRQREKKEKKHINIAQQQYIFDNLNLKYRKELHNQNKSLKQQQQQQQQQQQKQQQQEQEQEQEDLIVLQEEIWYIQSNTHNNNLLHPNANTKSNNSNSNNSNSNNNSSRNNNSRNNNSRNNNGDSEKIFRLQVDQDQQQKQIAKIKKSNYKIQTTHADLSDSPLVSKNMNNNNKRRKIFVYTQKNFNADNNYGLNIQKKNDHIPFKKNNPLQNNQQLLTPSFKQLHLNKIIQPDLQLSVQSSIYSQRQIPVNSIHHHPNSNPKTKTKIAIPQHINSISIQEFEKIMHANSLNIYEKWRKFISHLTEPEGLLLITAYSNEYKKKLVELLGESVIRFKGSWQFDIYSKEDGLRNKMAYQIRNQVIQNEKNIKVNQFRFYDKQLFDKNKPIMFQQVFQKISQKVSNKQENLHQPQIFKNKKSFIKVSLSCHREESEQITHIIFLVHGLGACRIDMQKLKIQIKRSFKQKVTIVTSSSNQGRTQGDIALMGVRLAHEVAGELSKHIDNFDNIDGQNIKVSFIGHSMGGIIIRSALPKLQKYKKFFHSFVTLSSPHIGYNYSSSKLIDVGLWLINNWKKCQSILQLTMSDGSRNNVEDTFLYKLSLQKGLQWFKKVTFLASRQDLYVPYFSARVQKPQQILNDIKSSNQYAITHSKMVDNMLSRILGTLTRIDVNFCITEQNIDNLIGRAAHICFVNNENFLRLLCVADQTTLI